MGKASTTAITKGRDAQGLDENKVAAILGGEVAGNARKELEEKSGEKVVSEKSGDNPKELEVLKSENNKIEIYNL